MLHNQSAGLITGSWITTRVAQGEMDGRACICKKDPALQENGNAAGQQFCAFTLETAGAI
jgi:hypothetical protein